MNKMMVLSPFLLALSACAEGVEKRVSSSPEKATSVTRYGDYWATYRSMRQSHIKFRAEQDKPAEKPDRQSLAKDEKERLAL
ncbi:hypothetical protein AQ1_02681 [alpha proteobacterium Q-1]|nr:hypothetical protein [Iodidimonas nitroreducens]GAK34774.1 hypothetical protein AQ1_02681 [alpha proteobacterium Q-1]